MATSTTSIPYSWLKQIPLEEAQLESIPRMGYPPPIPLDKISELISQHFEIQGVEIQAAPAQWRQADSLYSGLGEPLRIFHGVLSPLDGSWAWAMAEEDLAALMGLLLAKDDSLTIPNSEYKDSFARFLALEILHVYEKLQVDTALIPHLTTGDQPLDTPGYCTDVTITMNNRHFHGRFIISHQLHQGLKERYTQRGMNVEIPTEMAQKLSTILHLEVGKTRLTQGELRSLSLGDVVLLDKCSVNPGEQKGRVMLTLNGNPLYRGMVKPGGIKILEFPQYFEVEDNMAKNRAPGNGNEHEEHEEELETEFDQELEDESFIEEGEEEQAEADDEETEGEFSEEHEVEEEEEETEEESEVEEAEAPSAPAMTAAKEAPGMASLQELPLTVVVEIGRVQMSIQQLMTLQPGSLLELDVHPESGVDLVVNQQLIGKGELVRIGDAIGVRILDIGK